MKKHVQKILVTLFALFFLVGVSGSLALAAGIDINTASVTELTKIPGIGKATAEKIVAERAKNGNFKDIQDLQKRVSGIGPKTSEKMKDSISFSDIDSKKVLEKPQKALDETKKVADDPKKALDDSAKAAKDKVVENPQKALDDSKKAVNNPKKAAKDKVLGF